LAQSITMSSYLIRFTLCCTCNCRYLRWDKNYICYCFAYTILKGKNTQTFSVNLTTNTNELLIKVKDLGQFYLNKRSCDHFLQSS